MRRGGTGDLYGRAPLADRPWGNRPNMATPFCVATNTLQFAIVGVMKLLPGVEPVAIVAKRQNHWNCW